MSERGGARLRQQPKPQQTHINTPHTLFHFTRTQCPVYGGHTACPFSLRLFRWLVHLESQFHSTVPPQASLHPPKREERMDAPEEDLDIKLQQLSGDLIADFDQSLPGFLRRQDITGSASVRSRVRTRELQRFVSSVRLLSPQYVPPD